MPFFRVTFERRVSRHVELRQTASVVVEALTAGAANEAARSAALDEELDEYHAGWADDDSSRRASNDTVERGPRITTTVTTSMPWRLGWICGLPDPEPKETDRAG